MFGMLFKQKGRVQNNPKVIAKKLYACALEHTREPVFYQSCGVPDTFDGRFDLLLVHIFIIYNGLMVADGAHKDLAQFIFDETFKDMDQTLREMGIGDVGVPKHQKRMMRAFNGRMHRYQLAFDPSKIEHLIARVEDMKKTSLEDALRDNLFGTVKDEEWHETYAQKLVHFIRANIAAVQSNQAIDSLLLGEINFINDFEG